MKVYLIRHGETALKASGAYQGWIDGVLEGDLGRPRKQRHTVRRIYDRMVSDLGYLYFVA